MEQIGHLQWTLGIMLILTWVLHVINGSPLLSGWDIFILGWMAHFPDLIDLLWGKKGFNSHHRYLTHGLFFLAFWYILSYITGIYLPVVSRIIFLIAIGSTLHIAEDILAGGGYINLFSPFTKDFGKIMLVSRDHQIVLGKIVKNRASKYILGTESLTDDLAFFWLITMIGSAFFVAGVGLYLL